MEQLTERQKEILAIIVNSYVEMVSPVGSKMIAERYLPGVSPATIRNDMANLEELGFITHPHTSAGRVPTDKGYRFYVNVLLKTRSVDSSEAGLIAHEYRQKVRGIEELMERTSKILSFLTEQAGVVLYPSQKELVFKRIEFIGYGESHLLVLWMSTTGLIQNKMVDMEERVPNEELSRLANFLNAELSGKRFSDILPYLEERFLLAKDSLAYFYSLAQAIVSRTLEFDQEKRFCLDGSRFVLKQPEFQGDVLKTRMFFRTLETKETLREAFDQKLLLGEVRVRIGAEKIGRAHV